MGLTSRCDSSDASGKVADALQIKSVCPWQQNVSKEHQQSHIPMVSQQPTYEFLNPPYQHSGHLFKKSSESLQKNSSTDTDYSAHPYRFIKQSSNETTTSMTGSCNIDTPSLTAEHSYDVIDVQSSQIESPAILQSGTSFGGSSHVSARYQPLGASALGVSDFKRSINEVSASSNFITTNILAKMHAPSRALQLKKQLNLNQGTQQSSSAVTYRISSNEAANTIKKQAHLQLTSTSTSNSVLSELQTPSKQATSFLADAFLPSLVPAKLISSLQTPLRDKHSISILRESRSNTEEITQKNQSVASSSSSAVSIPQISTNLIQDEIAKLSSNIKSSTESEKDPPYNETMC